MRFESATIRGCFNLRPMCYTPDNTEFELTGRGFSKMKR